MIIKFDWTSSKEQMPAKGDNIVIYKPRYVGDDSMWKGKWTGLDCDYHGESFYMFKACELVFKQTLTFGPQCVVDIPKEEFFWDWISLTFNTPNKN